MPFAPTWRNPTATGYPYASAAQPTASTPVRCRSTRSAPRATITSSSTRAICSILIAADSVEKLRGATIDWSESPQRSGFRVINPNKPPALGALPTLPMSMAPGVGAPGPPPVSPRPLQGDLDSDLARRVMAVLDRDVNPRIAAHGGHAELAGIEGRTAYLRLGGGCQGCGMATVTLSQGIEVAITEAVPEISDVVDVTDHASGNNPYFEPAKK